MKTCFTLTVFLSFFLAAHSQTTYTKVIRSSFSSNARRMIATRDGGWLIVGNTGPGYNDVTTHDFFAIKFKPAGAQQWSVRVGTDGVNDEALSATQTKDGGYLLSGYSTDAAGKQIGALVRLDSSGNKLWSKTFAGALPLTLVSSLQTADGGFLAGGNYMLNDTTVQPVVIKLTAAGVVTNYLKPNLTATLRKIITADNGDFVFLLDDGAEYYDVKRLIVQRIAPGGTVRWSKRISTTHSETGYDLIQTANKDFVITGTNSTDGAFSYYMATMLRLDGNGNRKWYLGVNTGLQGGNPITAYSVLEDTDGSLIACGTTQRNLAPAGLDILLLKYTGAGGFVSSSYIDIPFSSGGYDDIGRGIVKAKDGGYIVISTSQAYGAAATLLKGDASFNFCIPKTPFTPGGQDTAFSLSPLPVSFSPQTGISATDALSVISNTVTLEGKCSTSSFTETTTTDAAPALKVYPNPAAGVLNLSFTGSKPEKGMVQVYDLAGNRYLQQPVSVTAGENSFHLTVSSLRSGQYKLVLSYGGGVLTMPFYKQ